jgi:hypothetical protein
MTEKFSKQPSKGHHRTNQCQGKWRGTFYIDGVHNGGQLLVQRVTRYLPRNRTFEEICAAVNIITDHETAEQTLSKKQSKRRKKRNPDRTDFMITHFDERGYPDDKVFLSDAFRVSVEPQDEYQCQEEEKIRNQTRQSLVRWFGVNDIEELQLDRWFNS